MYGPFREFLSKTFLTTLSSVFALLTFSSALHAQEEGPTEELVVTGFRGSLEAALTNKRDSANSIESIVAEDLGKMPDLNLAESLQRVPGVAITREGGEGRQITVRGLGAEFTRTTLNGMEVPSSTGGNDSSGGVNRGREFDFNLFSSDLFNRIDIHKSYKASLEEGGLASTVEMYTAKPFDNPGFHINANVQVSVENVAEETDPRVNFIVSNTFMDDTLGVLLSLNQAERTIRQDGFGTVRWMTAEDNGRSFVDNASLVINGGTPNPSANDPAGDFGPGDRVEDFLLHPRLPRTDFFGNDLERTGSTLAVQFRPMDRLELGLDVVNSELTTDRESHNFFAQFRDANFAAGSQSPGAIRVGFSTITPLELTLDPSGQYVVAGTYSGVVPRSESRLQLAETDFNQTVLTAKYDISDTVVANFLVGSAESEHVEDQLRFNIDALFGANTTVGGQPAGAAANRTSIVNPNIPGSGTDPTLFRFDFSDNSNIAELYYGFDITDPGNFEIANSDLRRDIVTREYETVRADFEFTGSDSLVYRAGLIANNRSVDAARQDPVNSSGTVIAAGALTNRLVSAFPGWGEVFSVDGFASQVGAPSGLPRNWVITNFDAAAAAYGLTGNFIDRADGAASFLVEEDVMSAYFDMDFETDFVGRPLRLNGGVRFVQTETTSTGKLLISGQVTDLSVTTEDDEVLPAINAVWEVLDDFQLRLNMSRNLTRPGLATLAPNITAITPTIPSISIGNPNLDPTMADSIDLAFEWYFAEESLLALTLINKDFDNFIESQTITAPLPENLRPIVLAFSPAAAAQIDADWTIQQSVNAGGGSLDGYELAYQQPFTFLPGFLSNFGMVANFTHIESDELVTQLSENSYNFSLYYETEVWGARVSVNDRDDYVTQRPGQDSNAENATTGPTRVDLSTFYDFTDQIKVSLEVINLTEEDERLYTTGPAGDLDLVREFNNTGREVYLGARFSY